LDKVADSLQAVAIQWPHAVGSQTWIEKWWAGEVRTEGLDQRLAHALKLARIKCSERAPHCCSPLLPSAYPSA
jgi:hypothetical protein